MSDINELKVLIGRRNLLNSRVRKLYELGQECQTNTLKVRLFKIEFESLDSLAREFENVHDNVNLKQMEIDPKHEYSCSEAEEFDDLIRAIKELSVSLFEEKPLAQDGSIISPNCKLVKPKLPTIQLPTFNGTLNNWMTFYDIFKSLIHDNELITPIEKFHYLLSSVSGPALGIVKSLPLTEANYSIVWEALIEKYHNKRVLGNSLLDVIFDFVPFQKETLEGLSKFLEVFYENVVALKSLGISDLTDFILTYLALRTLPSETRKNFELQNRSSEMPTFHSLIEFIQNQSAILEISHNQVVTPKFHIKPLEKRKTFVMTSSNSSCLLCHQDHSLVGCPTFLRLSPFKRKEKAKTLGLCFNCLKLSHRISNCSSKNSCRSCNQRHHSLLHFGTRLSPKPEAVAGPSSTDPVASTTCHASIPVDSSKTKLVLLGTAVVHVLDCEGKFQKLRVLIDSCAQTSFITTSAANRLRLPISKTNVSLAGLSQTPVPQVHGISKCLIKPCDTSSPVLETTVVILSKITGNMPAAKVPSSVYEQFKHLKLADPKFDISARIDMLLGADVFGDIYDGKRVVGKEGYPVALSSIFGWVITGKVDSENSSRSLSFLTCVEHQSLDEDLKRFWQTEEVPSAFVGNPDHEHCEKIFQDKHYRDEAGRYVVPLLFKDDPVNKLDLSFDTALSRLKGIERRLSYRPELRDSYNQFLCEYEQLGHMSLYTSSDSKNTYFIPHHCVVKDSSSTTKVRVVFDASCKTSSGYSLNDLLHIGPKLQRDITEIVTKFRFHQIAFTADICKMYRQILVHPEDRKYQHILWRDCPTNPVREYELNTVTYGVSSAPYLAIRVLQQLADDEGAEFPAAARVLRSDIYIDDIVTGANTLEEATILRQQLISLLQLGGFELHKWCSSSRELLNCVPEVLRESSVSFDVDGSSVISVLGLQWNSTSDMFTYRNRIKSTNVLCTKRSILSHIARLYDPLGWICPVIFKAKHLLQLLWKLGIDWDDIVPQHIEKEWKRILLEFDSLSELNIPRYIMLPNVVTCDLIGCCDASELGYAAVVYLKVTDGCGGVKITLLVAKSKVAPLRTLSVPRLELCGAVLLSKLVSSVLSFFDSAFVVNNIYLFSDSVTVLSWLKSPPHTLKSFVANRVVYILNNVPSSSLWFHISSHDNPADCASRGLTPKQLLNYSNWWSGPQWFKLPLESWPIQDFPKIDADQLPEIKRIENVLMVETERQFDLFERFSSFIKLQHVTAWCLRFKTNSLKQNINKSSYLTCSELNSALLALVKIVQQQYFGDDIKCILNKRQCSRQLMKLSPFVDSHGLLRVGGRLRNSNLKFNHKYPLLLPKSAVFTAMLVAHYHNLYCHASNQLLQSLLARRFWILGIRQLIKRVIFNCNTCYRLKASSLNPLMGDLPSFRCRLERPFFHVGVDYAGPFMMKEGSRRSLKTTKAYLCIFVCMATKATHLELVSNLTSEAFMATLDRFIARRGLCGHIYSDCGTNFVGAARELAAFQTPKFQDEVASYLENKQIQWHFNPPSSPHFGGLWEAAVKSAKAHLLRVAGNRSFTFEELYTLFSRIEAILNSRPLCALSTSPEDVDCLTPGHFLIGGPLVTPPEVDYTETPLNRLSRWELVKQSIQHFWRRWNLEYLHTLQNRSKWFKKEPPLAVDDIVILKDKHSCPLQWKLGRIVAIHPGQDGIVRVVSVRFKSGIVKRSVHQLVKLPSS